MLVKVYGPPAGTAVAGHQPEQAANSRPDLNAEGSPIAAIVAVAVSTPSTSASTTPLIEKRRKIKELTIQKRRLAHHRQAA